MILGFKKRFPWGVETHFVEKIKQLPGYKPKLHTMREGERWKEGMTIHFAINVRTKDYFQFYDGVCWSTQQVIIINHPDYGIPIICIDGKILTRHQKDILALNDGFDSLEDLGRWFHKPVHVIQLIHWTDLKY